MTRTIPLLLTVLLVAALAAGSAPVAASHDDGGGLGDGLAPHDDGSLIDSAIGAATGITDRARYAAGSLLGDSPDAQQDRDNAVEAFNSNSEAFVAYANERGLSDGEVIELVFVQDSESTAYIVADYDETAGEYTGAEAVTDTDRAVDHEVRLEGMASDNAAEEIERFNDEFAEPDADVTTSYASEMASKYLGLVEEPFTDGGED